ncbi:hypothetical protein QNH20_04870 [Neobacillus sp. WH10]|uniref:hypothetical protein n=1 Tax=Neobacillus sp. WH10 TaxID=3047873 RepID=UPI0024C1398B|nr:hypothetical protein [Neobacillus sp. WH10]WHY78483.1 hypothetical protein QNH20_04870 [Neobacillus sp. WH10]
MIAPKNILTTWKKFDDFPMETLTKAWFHTKSKNKKQRDVSLMREHREQFGITGNCFDLAIWLLDEFQKDGITAYPIGHHLNTSRAHVAVIALDEAGNRFLCDLGDQWLTPILIDEDNEDFTEKRLSGFFPGAQVHVKSLKKSLEVFYHRPNSKQSKQIYDTQPIEIGDFFKAAEYSQNVIKPKPLLECRIPYKSEIAHWEFYGWESFFSTSEGLFREHKLNSIDDWAYRINEKTGYDMQFLIEALELYKGKDLEVLG